MVVTVLMGIRFALTRAEHPVETLRGIWAGFREIARGSVDRAPIRLRIYRLFRRLKKRGPLPLSDLDSLADAR
jgi:hypothetical protein